MGRKLVSLLLCVLTVLAVCVVPASAADGIAERLDYLESVALPQLIKKLNECEQMGITTDYETVNKAALEFFIPVGRSDLAAENFTRAEYITENLERLYEEASEQLDAYRNGYEKPKAVSRYVTGDSGVTVGTSLTAQVRDAAGRETNQSVYLNAAYGINDPAQIKEFGFNYAYTEMGPSSVIVSPQWNQYGWKGMIVGWDSKNVYALHDATGGIGGTGALRLKTTNSYAPSQFFQITQTVPVEPNTEYEIGMSSKAISGGGLSYCANNWEGRVGLTTETSGFKETSSTYRTGPDQTSATLMIILADTADVLVDNAYYRKKGTTENLLINGDFEKELEVQNGLGVDCSAIDRLCKTLERFEQEDIAVTLLLSPHYFPTFVLGEDPRYVYPDRNSPGGNGQVIGFYIPYVFDRVQEVLNLYIDRLVPRIKDYKSLVSLDLANEVMYNLRFQDENTVRPLWNIYLQGKYGTIETLRAKWGDFARSYQSFDDVPIPNGVTQTVLYNEFRIFNEEFLGNLFTDMSKRVKSIAPDMPVHVKVVNYISAFNSTQYMDTGTDANMFAALSDMHGNDSHGYEESSSLDSVSNATLLNKMEWYDYLRTVDDSKVIINTEDHTLRAGSTDFSERQWRHQMTDLLQGAVHGRSGSALWHTWDETNPLLCRPDVVAELGKASLDLNRMPEVFEALRDAPADVAVYFSNTTRVYRYSHVNALYRAHSGVMFSGHKPLVADEIALKNGVVDNCKLIILPDVTHLTEEAFASLERLQQKGIQLLLVGDRNAMLRYNEYGQPNDAARVENLLNNATVLPAQYSGSYLSVSTVEEVRAKTAELVGNEFEVRDAATGQPVKTTEWRAVPYKNGYLFNLNRYEWGGAQTVELWRNGQKAVRVRDLRAEEERAQITLEGYTPLFLYAEFDLSGNTAEASEVFAGYENNVCEVSWRAPEGFQGKVNVYRTADGVTKQMGSVAAETESYSFPVRDRNFTVLLRTEDAEGRESPGVTAQPAGQVSLSYQYTGEGYEFAWHTDESISSLQILEATEAGETPIAQPDVAQGHYYHAAKEGQHRYIFRFVSADGSVCRKVLVTPAFEVEATLSGLNLNIRGRTGAWEEIAYTVTLPGEEGADALLGIGETVSHEDGSFAFTVPLSEGRIDGNQLFCFNIRTRSHTYAAEYELIYKLDTPLLLYKHVLDGTTQLALRNVGEEKITDATVLVACYDSEENHRLMNTTAYTLQVDTGGEVSLDILKEHLGHEYCTVYVWKNIMEPLSKKYKIQSKEEN